MSPLRVGASRGLVGFSVEAERYRGMELTIAVLCYPDENVRGLIVGASECPYITRSGKNSAPTSSDPRTGAFQSPRRKPATPRDAPSSCPSLVPSRMPCRWSSVNRIANIVR